MLRLRKHIKRLNGTDTVIPVQSFLRPLEIGIFDELPVLFD